MFAIKTFIIIEFRLDVDSNNYDRPNVTHVRPFAVRISFWENVISKTRKCRKHILDFYATFGGRYTVHGV